jgi:uroporphyrinogen decarboxylase
MNHWQRFLNTVQRKEIDHIPVALIGTPRFFASLANVNLSECLKNSNKLMEVQLEAFKKFSEITFIPGCWPDYGVGLFSAFGGEIVWEKNAMPSFKEYPIKSAADIKSFKLPDPEKDGLLPSYLKTLRNFVKREEEFRDNLRFLHANGPGELGCHLWGMNNFLENVYLEPDLIKEFLEKLTDFIIIWLKAQKKRLNKAKGFLLTDDIAGLVSPEIYREFIFPYHRRIREEFKDYIFVFHCDTKSDHILEFLPQTGVDVFNLGPDTDMANAKKKIGEKVCLMGNIDPVNVMQKKDVKIIKKEAQRCFKEAASNGGYFLSIGGGMNENTPEENVKTLVEEAKQASSI